MLCGFQLRDWGFGFLVEFGVLNCGFWYLVCWLIMSCLAFASLGFNGLVGCWWVRDLLCAAWGFAWFCFNGVFGFVSVSIDCTLVWFCLRCDCLVCCGCLYCGLRVYLIFSLLFGHCCALLCFVFPAWHVGDLVVCWTYLNVAVLFLVLRCCVLGWV